MKKVHIPQHITTTVFEGSSIVLDLRQNLYYALNDTAAIFWNLLIELGSIEAALAEILKLYNASPDVIEDDMKKFVHSLIKAGLIEKIENDI